MRIVFMGTPDFAVPILEGLIENYDVIGVVSQPDKKVGRKQILTETPIKKVALKNNIKVFQPENIKKDYQQIIEMNPDIIITCAYGQIIPKELLEYPKYKCINVHASLLPKLRGGAPIHKAIIEGYEKTGITIMYMDEAMDSGDVIAKSETIIKDSDNLESLHDRLSIMGKDLLLNTLPSIINGTNKRIKQDLSEVTYAYNIKREEEHIDFSKSSREIFNLVRGLDPMPGAYTLLDDEVMKIYKTIIKDKKCNSNEYGKIIDITKEGIEIVTKDNIIIITELKPFGKKKMKVKDYINGIRKEDLIGKILK